MDISSDPESGPGLTAPAFALLVVEGACWKCHQPTPVVALWVPEFTLDEGDGDCLSDPDPAVLQYIEALPPHAVERLAQEAPWLRPAHTVGAELTYWANHCTACGAVQGDHYLFGPDGPFWPQTDEEIRRIRFVAVRERLECNARPASSSWMGRIERLTT